MQNPISFRNKPGLKFALVIASGLLFILGTLACQKESPAPAQRGTETAAPSKPSKAALPPPPRATPAPQSRDIILASSYTGEVKSLDRVDLTTKLTGRIKEIKVDIGAKVKKGDLLVVVEHDVQDIQLKQAEAALDQARTNLAKIEDGPRKEQIAVAEASLKNAQAQLDLLLAGTRKEDIAAARAKLEGAQSDLDALLAGATPQQLQEKVSDIKAAEAKLNSVDVETTRTLQITRIADTEALNYALATRETQLALQQAQVQITKDKLESLKAPPTPAQIAKLRSAVDTAKAQLDALLAPPRPQETARLESSVASAREQLDLTKNPFTRNDLETARIGILQAQNAIDLAKSQRDEAFLYAPFDGTIAARSASEGALASPSLPLVTIISRDIQISIAVEEAAVGKVKIDQIWDLRVLAYPDRVFKGKVKAISPVLNPATRTFDVLLMPEGSEGLLLPGMFITASLPQ